MPRLAPNSVAASKKPTNNLIPKNLIRYTCFGSKLSTFTNCDLTGIIYNRRCRGNAATPSSLHHHLFVQAPFQVGNLKATVEQVHQLVHFNYHDHEVYSEEGKTDQLHARNYIVWYTPIQHKFDDDFADKVGTPTGDQTQRDNSRFHHKLSRLGGLRGFLPGKRKPQLGGECKKGEGQANA